MAGVEGDSRCWACLLLSFEMKVTVSLSGGVGSPPGGERAEIITRRQRGRGQMSSYWLS